MYIKSNLKYLRTSQKLSLRQLANKLTVSSVALSKIELGKSCNPRILTLIEICSYFEVDLSDFIYCDFRRKSDKKLNERSIKQ